MKRSVLESFLNEVKFAKFIRTHSFTEYLRLILRKMGAEVNYSILYEEDRCFKVTLMFKCFRGSLSWKLKNNSPYNSAQNSMLLLLCFHGFYLMTLKCLSIEKDQLQRRIYDPVNHLCWRVFSGNNLLTTNVPII